MTTKLWSWAASALLVLQAVTPAAITAFADDDLVSFGSDDQNVPVEPVQEDSHVELEMAFEDIIPVETPHVESNLPILDSPEIIPETISQEFQEALASVGGRFELSEDLNNREATFQEWVYEWATSPLNVGEFEITADQFEWFNSIDFTNADSLRHALNDPNGMWMDDALASYLQLHVEGQAYDAFRPITRGHGERMLYHLEQQAISRAEVDGALREAAAALEHGDDDDDEDGLSKYAALQAAYARTGESATISVSQNKETFWYGFWAYRNGYREALRQDYIQTMRWDGNLALCMDMDKYYPPNGYTGYISRPASTRDSRIMTWLNVTQGGSSAAYRVAQAYLAAEGDYSRANDTAGHGTIDRTLWDSLAQAAQSGPIEGRAWEIDNGSYQRVLGWEKDREPRYFTANIIKQDSETGSRPQNTAQSLSATFGLYTRTGALLRRVTTDRNGRGAVSGLVAGSYYWQELVPPSGYRLNSTQYPFTLSESQTSSTSTTTVQNDILTTRLRIQKRDVDTGTVPQNRDQSFVATFGLYRESDGQLVDRVTTDRNGVGVSKDVPPGNYYWQELTPPNEYHLNSTRYPVRLTSQQATQSIGATTTISNKVKRGSLQLDKSLVVDREDGFTGDVVVEGAEFKLVDIEQPSRVYYATVTRQGNAFFDNLPYGRYRLEEVKTPIGVSTPAAPIEITIDQDSEIDGPVGAGVTNDVDAEGQFRFTKLGEHDWRNGSLDEHALSGVWFTLRDVSSGQVIDRVQSNTQGDVAFVGLPMGRYVVTEDEALEGYFKYTEEIRFDVDEHGSVVNSSIPLDQPTVVNQTAKAGLRILKKDKNPLRNFMINWEGTEFKVKNLQSGEYVTHSGGQDVFRTNSRGVVEPISGLYLPYGDYRLEEIKAPQNYTIDHTPVPFSVGLEDDGGVVEVTMSNERVKGEVSLEKRGDIAGSVNVRDSEYGPIHDLTFDNKQNLEGTTFDLFAEVDIVLKTGDIAHRAGDKIGTYTTDRNGKLTVGDLEIGSYYFVETAAPSGWLIDDTPIRFDINYENQDVPLVTAGVGQENAYQDVRLELVKEDEVQTGLDVSSNPEHGEVIVENRPGFDKEFIVQTVSPINDGSGRELVPADGIVALIKTDQSGHAHFEGKLPEGQYTVKEVKTTQNYDLLDKVYPFEVSASHNNRVSVLSLNELTNNGQPFVNVLRRPKIQTSAVNKEDGSKLVSPEIEVTIIDTVTYENLFTDREYTMKGVLMDKTTGEPLLVDGKEIRSEVKFIPSEPNGEVDLEFTFDGRTVRDKDVVVFEDIYQGDIHIATHHDLEDEHQTVHFPNPEIGTLALNTLDDSKTYDPEDEVELIDTIEYTDIVPGYRYKFTGVLMDKETGEPVLAEDGLPIETIEEFDLTETDGAVDVYFHFNASRVRGKDLVVYETMERLPLNKDTWNVVAEHKDINDLGQTVHVTDPWIQTVASFNPHVIKNSNRLTDLVIRDVVQLNDVVVGREYVLDANIREAITGNPLTHPNGSPIGGYSTVVMGGDNTFIVADPDRLFVQPIQEIVSEEPHVEVEEPDVGEPEVEEPEVEEPEVEEPEVEEPEVEEPEDKPMYIEIPSAGGGGCPPGYVFRVEAVANEYGSMVVSEVKHEDPELRYCQPVEIEVFKDDGCPSGYYEQMITGGLPGEPDTKEHEDPDMMYCSSYTIHFGGSGGGGGGSSGGGGGDFSGGGSYTAQGLAVAKSDANLSGEEDLDTPDTEDPEVEDDDVVVGEPTEDEPSDDDDESVVDVPTSTFRFDSEGPFDYEVLDLPLIELEAKDGSLRADLPGNESEDVTSPEDDDVEDSPLEEAKLSNLFGLLNPAKADAEGDDGGVPEDNSEDTEDEPVDDNEDTEDPDVNTSEDDTFVYPTELTKDEYLLTVKDGLLLAYTLDGQVLGIVQTLSPEEVEALPVGTRVYGYSFVDVTLNGHELDASDLVAYEKLTRNDTVIATHEDPEDDDQIVHLTNPDVQTTLLGIDDEKNLDPLSEIAVTDYIEVSDVLNGFTYTLDGVLMDKATGEPIVSDGEPVVEQVIFEVSVPGAVYGQRVDTLVEMPFILNARDLYGVDMVAFETLSYQGEVLAEHRDLNDLDQTVHLTSPEIGTTLMTQGEDKVVDGRPEIELIDHIQVEDVLNGVEYEVSGYLVDKETEEIVPGTETTFSFVVEEDAPKYARVDTMVQMVFNIDATAYRGRDLVAYETLSRNEDVLAEHKDINDLGQTVGVTDPKIGTRLAYVDGYKAVHAVEDVHLVDVIDVYNVVQGQTYELDGVLMDKSTGEPLPGTEETITFTVEDIDVPKGELVPHYVVEMPFVLQAQELAGQEVVAFETLRSGDHILAEHKDLEDKGQTIQVLSPDVKTLLASYNGDKSFPFGGDIELLDTVSLTNVINGEVYTLEGILMNKATHEQAVGSEVVEHTFKVEVPGAAQGAVVSTTIQVPFILDSTELMDQDVVAFETLYFQDQVIAEHKDIEDENQTIHIEKPVGYPRIGTSLATVEGDKAVNPIGVVELIDHVDTYELTHGETYILKGLLMNKELDIPVPGSQVEVEFVAEGDGLHDGEIVNHQVVQVPFEIDVSELAGVELVAFEEVIHKESGELVAEHKDIHDENQTIEVVSPDVGTLLATYEGDKTINPESTVELVDKVQLENVVNGATYVLKGVLMDKSDETEIPDTFVEQEVTIDVGAAPLGHRVSTVVEMPFTLETKGLAGQDVVAYEELYFEDQLLAEHKDINDLDQTVHVREIPKRRRQQKTPRREEITRQRKEKEVSERPRRRVEERPGRKQIPGTGGLSGRSWVWIVVVVVLVAGGTYYYLTQQENNDDDSN